MSSKNKRKPVGGGRVRQQPRLTAHKREAVDLSLVALCYWLIAQRLVEEAEGHGEFDCPDPEEHPEHQGGRAGDGGKERSTPPDANQDVQERGRS